VTRNDDLTFVLSAAGGVAPWTWIDHPAGTIGYFVDNTTQLPLNGFYLVPGQDRTGMFASVSVTIVSRYLWSWFTVKFIMNKDLSKTATPNPADFVVRSLWNNTHAA
jgi:beta-mannosidase